MRNNFAALLRGEMTCRSGQLMESRNQAGRENQRPAVPEPGAASVPKLKSLVGQQIMANHCGAGRPQN